jgi:hypothetical protein
MQYKQLQIELKLPRFYLIGPLIQVKPFIHKY